MRRTGKTTRLIDKAVQELFTEGEIYIPHRPLSENDKKGLDDSEIEKRSRYMDDEGCQKNFFNRLINRLRLEHAYQFELEGNLIKLKNK